MLQLTVRLLSLPRLSSSAAARAVPPVQIAIPLGFRQKLFMNLATPLDA